MNQKQFVRKLERIIAEDIIQQVQAGDDPTPTLQWWGGYLDRHPEVMKDLAVEAPIGVKTSC